MRYYGVFDETYPLSDTELRLESGIVRLVGWNATVLLGDPLTFDKWKWLKHHHLVPGPLRIFEAGSDNIHVRKILTEQQRRKVL